MSNLKIDINMPIHYLPFDNNGTKFDLTLINVEETNIQIVPKKRTTKRKKKKTRPYCSICMKYFRSDGSQKVHMKNIQVSPTITTPPSHEEAHAPTIARSQRVNTTFTTKQRNARLYRHRYLRSRPTKSHSTTTSKSQIEINDVKHSTLPQQCSNHFAPILL
jgi:hypothetical protein